jgi:CRISPR/Cas system CSM-associated protein Csm3 (group 7 of RAMP superfamily)
MDRIALLQWDWQPTGPLVTGYSQNLAQAAGLIRRGERKVVNLQTRGTDHVLQPSFLASSIKGVFRTAAAWLVERTAREHGADAFVTCDYGRAVPVHQRPRLGIRARPGLCPICGLFGGAGCLAEEGAPFQRQQGRVRFTFNRADNAVHGRVTDSPPYRWAWEQIQDRGKALTVEQLQFAPDTMLMARVERADDFALALLLLAGDLVSSGFFRFGRFTTRGYGVVRLQPAAYLVAKLDALLAGDDLTLEEVKHGQNGHALADTLLGRDPVAIVAETVAAWMKVEPA